jgi:heat shock protein HtpX
MIIVAVVLAVLAPIFARLLQLSISRQREYLADATAVKLTRNPKGLADALQKISGDTEVLEVANRATAHLYIVNPIKKFEKRAKGLFSTHPPIEERIQILRSLETGGMAQRAG